MANLATSQVFFCFLRENYYRYFNSVKITSQPNIESKHIIASKVFSLLVIIKQYYIISFEEIYLKAQILFKMSLRWSYCIIYLIVEHYHEFFNKSLKGRCLINLLINELFKTLLYLLQHLSLTYPCLKKTFLAHLTT